MATRDGFRSSRENRITRDSKAVPALCHATTPDVIDFRGASGGQLITPAGTQSQTLVVKVAATETGTFVPLIDVDGEAVTIDVEASQAYDLPEAIFASAYVQFVAESAKDFTATLALKG